MFQSYSLTGFFYVFSCHIETFKSDFKVERSKFFQLDPIAIEEVRKIKLNAQWDSIGIFQKYKSLLGWWNFIRKITRIPIVIYHEKE